MTEVKMYITECWIEHPVRKLDTTFTYISNDEVFPGCRVKIPFHHRTVTGFVEKVTETSETKEEAEKRLGMKLSPVSEVIDRESLITPELHDLAMWMRRETLSTAISCFQTMLPAKLKPRSSHQKAVTERWIRISDEEVSLTPKQIEAWEYVRENGPMRYRDLRKKYPNQAAALVSSGALLSEEREREAASTRSKTHSSPLVLTPLQKQAMDEILHSDDPVYLIRGVTGSGKTEIYLQLAAEALERGKQVLILVPEIGLTPQMITRVSERFGEELAIYHSGLNPQEKYEQYRKVKSGRAAVVVGTRSAVFLPFADLGLIVMDEEHDNSYKQDQQPCYHCRDIAVWRGRYHHCRVILGSATPSLESYARSSLRNIYHLITMDERINQTLPEVTVVPMKECLKRGESYILSDLLKEKISERLTSGRQIILLLNRRGYNTLLRCRECQEPVKCPHCDLAMSYHRDIGRMKCHTCGTEMPVPKVCSHCNSKAGFAAFGFGTEKLEAEIKETFPAAKVLRMDADTTGRKDSHADILNRFGRGEADILVGTQMIAKGLDYPNVTLVGIINGDDGLARTDYRSCEVTFDLLMQAAGRSGRGDSAGDVILQVYEPDHYAVQCAVQQDYPAFFAHEMRFRHAGQYPPYVYMIALTFSGSTQKEADEAAADMKQALNGSFKVIGVVSLLRLKDRCRSRIVMKGKDLKEMQDAVRNYIDSAGSSLRGLRIDVNPLYLD